MALTTYTELKAAVASWLKDTSLTSQIVDFITLGEARINAELRVRSMEVQGSAVTVGGTPTVALPTGYRDAKWLYLATDPKIRLEYASGEQIAQTYAGSSSGMPRVFAVEGENWRLGPTPDGVYTIQYLIHKTATPLSGSTATNVLFPRYNYLYLYAALIEAWNYLEDEAQVQKYEALYKRFLAIAKAEDDMDRHSGSTLRIRSDGNNP